MHSSSLLKILKILTPTELKQLAKFLNCSYLNKHKKSAQLFNILAQYYPDFDSPKLASEKLYKRVYKKAYEGNESNFRSLVAMLKKSVNEFLILEEFKEKTAQKNLLLLDAYIKRGAATALRAEVTKKYLDEEKTISSWYFYNRFQLYWKLYNEESADTYNRKSDSFNHLNKSLDYFFAMTKVKLGIEQQNLNKRKVQTAPIELIPAIQSFLADDEKNIPPIILLYTKLFELSQNPKNGVNTFKEVVELFKPQITQLSKEDAQDIVTILFNFANAKISQQIAPKTYKNLRFEIVKLGVTHGLYTDGNSIPIMTYKAIVLSAIAVSAFDWTTNFMADHQEYLTSDSKIFCIAECEGILYYYKAKKSSAPDLYLKCIESFNVPTERNDSFNKQKIWYTLIAYYEYFLLTLTELFFIRTHNLHTVIKRCKGFTEEEKRLLLNTLNALKYMAKTKLNPNSSPAVVKQKLNKYRRETHYRIAWITEMFEQFEQQI